MSASPTGRRSYTEGALVRLRWPRQRRVLDEALAECFDTGPAVIPNTPFPPQSQPGAPANGQSRAGKYDLVLELAGGGMAMVYLAYASDDVAGGFVAVKRPHRHLVTDKIFLTMLLDEARLASAIDHPNVVKVRELGFAAGEPFIVMDYVEGASLAELRTELTEARRAIDVKIAVRIVLDALAGLHAAHELTDDTGRRLGIVHRDISPHNILVGSDGRARVTDFGIAHAVDRLQTTKTHEIKGKLAYLAPERVDHRRLCTVQSDVFSMGIVLWESILGRRLFLGDEAVDTLQEVMHRRIPRLNEAGATVPKPLDDVVARALSRDLSTRFATAKDFAEALERAAGPALTGGHESTGQLIEALYGKRLAGRHRDVRAALTDDQKAETLFAATRLRSRPDPDTLVEPVSSDILEAVAPPAPPSEPYVFGAVGPASLPGPRRRARLVAAGGAASVIAVIGLVALTSRHPPTAAGALPQAAERAPARTPSGEWSTVTHQVTLPLPFVSSFVLVDGVGHPLIPAADVAAVTFPDERRRTHQVVATALDGTLAQADVEIVNGYAQAVGAGFVPVVRPTLAPSPPPALPPAPPPTTARGKPGTIKNGFTKLK